MMGVMLRCLSVSYMKCDFGTLLILVLIVVDDDYYDDELIMNR